MSIIYIDCSAGVSGEALMGSLIDQVEEKEGIVNEIKKIIREKFELKFEKYLTGDIAATKVILRIPKDSRAVRVQEFIEQVGIQEVPGNRITYGLHSTLKRYSAARARLKGIKQDNMSTDKTTLLRMAIITAGTFAALDRLAVKEVISAPIPIYGTSAGPQKKAQNPMLLEMAKGARVKTGVEDLAITTLGAALVASCADRFSALPEIVVTGAGYGVLEVAGKKESVLVTISGDTGNKETDTRESEEIFAVETNIDDMNPEIFPYVIENMLSAGANDAFLTPVIMKKGRPASLITVLCSAKDLDRIAEILFRETTTLGIRIRKEKKRRLERKTFIVNTHYGKINIKAGFYRQEKRPVQLAPEFEECKKIALKTGAPLKDIYNAALRAAQENGEI